MNIFVLDLDHANIARWHMDRHVVKMPLESAQMLCTVLNSRGVETPYRTVHAKHPCTIWAGMTRENFEWLANLGLYLCYEYTFRYNKVHACEKVIDYCLSKLDCLPGGVLTPFAQAMPDEYKDSDAVIAYRNYYKQGKTHLATWSMREKPDWY